MFKSLALLFLNWALLFSPDNVTIRGTIHRAQSSHTHSLSTIIYNNKDTLYCEIKDSLFYFPAVAPGQYYLDVVDSNTLLTQQYLGNITTDTTLDVTIIENVLKNVTIHAKRNILSQNGDTLVYDASAIKLYHGANTEDLLNMLPGVSVFNGAIKSSGEYITQIYVDGQPFFSNDINILLKSFPPELINKVQIFDRPSDQAAFTGFDDGKTKRTINIVTSKKNGIIGKTYAATDATEHYNVGASANLFRDKESISIVGQLNNVNQQNFGIDNTSSGMEPGVAKTSALGLNYKNETRKGLKVSGAYNLSATNKTQETNLTRKYFIADTTAEKYYAEKNQSNTSNTNNNLSFRIETPSNLANAMIIDTKLSTISTGKMIETYADMVSGNQQDIARASNQSDMNNLMLQTNVLLRHKFKQQGRTISASIDVRTQKIDNNNNTLSNSNADSATVNQAGEGQVTNSTQSVNFIYTEPIDKRSQAMISYNPEWAFSHSEKETYNFNSSDGKYSMLDTSLSNYYKTQKTSQRVEIGLRQNFKKLSYNVGLAYQWLILTGTQTFPIQPEISKGFYGILPNAFFTFKFSSHSNLRLVYHAFTLTPDIFQLQGVYNNSNPLLITTGNPALTQEIQHQVTVRYLTSSKNGNAFSVNFNSSVDQNHITTASTFLESDSILSGGMLVKAGSQISSPINVSGYKSGQLYGNYDFSVKALRSNLSINAGMMFIDQPSVLNDIVSQLNTYSFSFGGQISTTLKGLSLVTAYSIAQNIASNNSNYLTHTVNAKFNYTHKRFVVNMSFYDLITSNNVMQSGTPLLSSFVGYRFLKNRQLECRIIGQNIFNRQSGFVQSFHETYVEATTTNTLGRYFMVGLVYSLSDVRK